MIKLGAEFTVSAIPYTPSSLPYYWQEQFSPIPDIANAYRNLKNGMVVICGIDSMQNGSKFIHISCSFPDHLPSWNELKQVKDDFLGTDSYAYQVLPPTSEFINFHNYCLHLYSPIE